MKVAPSTGERVIIPPRRKLSAKQRLQVLLNGNGRCYLCSEKILDGDWEAEHPIPRELTGNDEIEHLRPAHVECHKPKTHGEDRPRIRKAKNQEKLRLDVPRTVSPAWRGKSRGFGPAVRVPARKA